MRECVLSSFTYLVLFPDEAYVSEDECACSGDELGSTDAECSLAESGYGGTHSPGLSRESRYDELLFNTEPLDDCISLSRQEFQS